MGRPSTSPSKCVLAALALFAATLGLTLSAGAAAQTVSEIEARDQLIADQENLLNAYRCLFNTDIELVSGGCGDPTHIEPGPAPDQPKPQDLELRDQLIANQEALLNDYRCQFKVDTELVPGGCPDEVIEGELDLGPRSPNQAWNVHQEIVEAMEACDRRGDYDNRRCFYFPNRSSRSYPDFVTTIEIGRRWSEFYGCDLLTGGFGHCQRDSNPEEEIWQKRIEFAEYLNACGYGRPYRSFDRDGTERRWSYYECTRDPHNPTQLARPEHNAEAARLGREALECDYDMTSRWGRPCRSNTRTWSGPEMHWLLSQIVCDGWVFHEDNSVENPPGLCYHRDHPQVEGTVRWVERGTRRRF